jgi:hypothetical protein
MTVSCAWPRKTSFPNLALVFLMPSFRVRVSWNNEHIVVPVPEDLFAKGTVTELLQLATNRFRQYSSVTFDVDNSFVKILTADGFAFAPSDALSSVLKDDDHLVVRSLYTTQNLLL